MSMENILYLFFWQIKSNVLTKRKNIKLTKKKNEEIQTNVYKPQEIRHKINSYIIGTGFGRRSSAYQTERSAHDSRIKFTVTFNTAIA